MQRIFVKDQPVSYPDLIELLDRNLETVASSRIGEVLFVPSRGDVLNLQNFVADNESYYTNLNAISLYEFEFEIRIDENGMKVRPSQLILGSALYPGRITFDNNPNDFFNDLESGLAFLIDFNDENTLEFFFSRGIGRSASDGLTSFYDLLMSFRYPHFFFSIDGIELARATDVPFEYELEFIREEVRTQLFSIMMEFTYGEIPSILRRTNP